MAKNPYELVQALRPGRSAFDLSHSKTFDCDIGQLVPVLVEDVIPGDVFHITSAHIIRAQPLVVPIYHALEVFVHYFFVPYRILWADWEKFITGGANGDNAMTAPKVLGGYQWDYNVDIYRYTLWDFFGLPIHDGGGLPTDAMTLDPDPVHVMPSAINDWPWRAYWAIWRDYYRDSNHQPNYPAQAGVVRPCGQDANEQLDNLQTFVDQSVGTDSIWYANNVAYRCWKKDYFTSALPWQQRGTSPAIPISGSSAAQWDLNQFVSSTGSLGENIIPIFTDKAGATPPTHSLWVANDTATGSGATAGEGAKNMQRLFNNNTVNFAASGVDINDMRYAVQIQKWMERSARGGFRYNEHLNAHFGVYPRDDRLQRPEYIGGTRAPVVISEVLQNSATITTGTDASPQGNMAGHGMSVNASFCGKYRAQEHGVIMGILSIMPEAIYQQGIPRMWTRETRFDYYSPEFAHLSEQEIKRQEVFWIGDSSSDNTRFGFQGAFDEYRTRQSVVCGKIATSLNPWTLSRIFDTAPALNADFLTTRETSRTRRDAWAVPGVVDNSQGQFLVQFRNIVKAIRPMPYIPEPGLMDHF